MEEKRRKFVWIVFVFILIYTVAISSPMFFVFLSQYFGENFFVITTIFTSFVSAFLTPILFLAFFVFAVRSAFSWMKIHREFIENYSKENSFIYFPASSLETVQGRLFKMADKSGEAVAEELFQKVSNGESNPLVNLLLNHRPIRNVMSGKYKDFPIRIFNFSYSEGGGKNKRTYEFTCCELSLEKTDFPFLLLKSNSMSRFGGRDMFGEDKDIEIKLEGDFGKTFRLFTRQNYEIEALQIFTPDVMAFLQDEAPNFSIEFAGNKVYLYDDKIISNKAEMDQMYAVLKKMVDTTGHFLNRLHDDYQVMHEVYDKDRQI